MEKLSSTSNNGFFCFQLPSNSYDPIQTLIEITMYNQIPFALLKVFLGSSVIPLEEVAVIRENTQLKFTQLYTLQMTKICHSETPEYLELKTRRSELSKAFVERYDKHRLERKSFASQEWAKKDIKNLISQHCQEICDFQSLMQQCVGNIKVRMAFEKKWEELYIEIINVDNVIPPRDISDVNICIGLRVLPTEAAEMYTNIYLNTTCIKFKGELIQDGKIKFKLNKVMYNYHHTFVQIVCYCMKSCRNLGKKLWEKVFLGQTMVVFGDIKPIYDIGQLRTVDAKTLKLISLKNFKGKVFQEIEQQKDKISKEFQEEFLKFKDRSSIKIANQLEKWKPPVSLAITNLISNYLEQVRLMQVNMRETTGLLRFEAQYESDRAYLNINLMNISQLKPLAKDDKCNFSLSITVLPFEKAPFQLTRSKIAIEPEQKNNFHI